MRLLSGFSFHALVKLQPSCIQMVFCQSLTHKICRNFGEKERSYWQKKLRGETKNKVRDMAISEDSDNAIIKVY